LPNHYLIFTLSSELLANKVVIKIFQNYIKILSYEFADEYVSFRIFSQGKWDIKL